jgi:hypothetical protein
MDDALAKSLSEPKKWLRHVGRLDRAVGRLGRARAGFS